LGISPALSFTLSALGARTRNVIFLSEETAGEMTRGPWGAKTRGGRFVVVEFAAAGVEEVADWAVPFLVEESKVRSEIVMIALSARVPLTKGRARVL
jgi:hypothetical protein